jgi:sporulation protein YlmC with PRC-barrel domain
MRSAIFAFFAMFLAASTATAQQPQSEISTTGTGATPIPGIDDATLTGSARVTKVIGAKVYAGDTTIGQIEDVLVDLERRTVTALILSVGGFLGVGEKLVAVPVDQVKAGKEARFTTDLSRDQLTRAPAFDAKKVR